MSVLGPMSNAHVVTKLPAQDLDRARRFYRDKLGLEPVEERERGLRFICAGAEFHLFSSSGPLQTHPRRSDSRSATSRQSSKTCVVFGGQLRSRRAPRL